MAINLKTRDGRSNWTETDDADVLDASRLAFRRPHWLTPPPGFPPATALTWALLRKALKGCPAFWVGQPVTLALHLPPGLATGRADFVLSRMVDTLQRGQLIGRRSSGLECIPVTVEARPRRAKDGSDARRMILQEAERQIRIVVLVEHGASLPDDTVELIDETIAIPLPSDRHLDWILRHRLRVAATPEIISELVPLPLQDLELLLRSGTSLRQIRDRLQRKRERQPASVAASPKGPSLEELPGMGAAAEWGLDLARDLTDWAAGRLAWADVDRGVLLHGKPGTGKTTFAKALAQSCGVPLIAGSISRWQAAGHLGEMLAAMRKAFREAIEQAPSILFIDELDSLGDRAEFGGENRTYNVQVINGLLECLDGVEGRDGVVVVGACNDPSRIDPAVTRSGRLDRQIEIPLPDRTTREAILRFHLAKCLLECNLAGIMDRTSGWTGADLERIVREARRRARKAQRPLMVEDLEACLPELQPLSPQDLWRAAVHEGGHAVAACVLGHVKIIGARLDREIAISDGGWTAAGGVMTSQPSSRLLRTETDWRADLVMLLAGLAAEEVILGSRSGGSSGGPGSDLHRATLLAARMEACLGIGKAPAALCADRETDLLKLIASDADLRGRVEARLAERYEAAKVIVRENLGAVYEVAATLRDEGRASEEEIETTVGLSRLIVRPSTAADSSPAGE